jgi:tRNA(fMet)-specific endonuclease VapC
MALRYLLDTNVVSELTKPAPNPAVLQSLARDGADCAICALTLEELVFGCRRLPAGARQDWLLRWLDGLPAQLPVLPFDAAAARWLGIERARLAQLGRPAPRTDGEIAAVAVAHGLTLVTRNLHAFAPFDALAMVDWHR